MCPKTSESHHFEKNTIAVALSQKLDHRSSLNALHYIAISTELILPAAGKAVNKNKGRQKNMNECIKLKMISLSKEQ